MVHVSEIDDSRSMLAMLGWLGGIVDGEGTIYAGWWKQTNPKNRDNHGMRVAVTIPNTHPLVIRRITEILVAIGVNFNCVLSDRKRYGGREKPTITVTVMGTKSVLKILENIIPYATGKHRQCELAVDLIKYRESLALVNRDGKGRFGDLKLREDETINFLMSEIKREIHEYPSVLNYLRFPGTVFGEPVAFKSRARNFSIYFEREMTYRHSPILTNETAYVSFWSDIWTAKIGMNMARLNRPFRCKNGIRIFFREPKRFFGAANPRATLTRENVIEILQSLADGCSEQKLADHFKVSQAHIWRIAHGKAWVHLAERDELLPDIWRASLAHMGGDDHPSTKLTNWEVTEIRQLCNDGFPVAAIADAYGVAPAHIYRIRPGGSRRQLVP